MAKNTQPRIKVWEVTCACERQPWVYWDGDPLGKHILRDTCERCRAKYLVTIKHVSEKTLFSLTSKGTAFPASPSAGKVKETAVLKPRKSKLTFSDMGAAVACDDCGWEGLEEETLPISSHHILESLSPGCPTPRGACPSEECGAWCYYIDPYVRGDGNLSDMTYANDEE